MAGYKKNSKMDLVCKWTGCSVKETLFTSRDELSLHVHDTHLDPIANNDLFLCLWEGCKVYNKPSYSFEWLKRHTREKHTKERPHKCLMNGCNMAFNTVEALEKHVSRHFHSSPPPKAKTVQSNPSRALTPPLLHHPLSLGEHEELASEIASIGSSANSLHRLGSMRDKKRLPMKAKIPRHTYCAMVENTTEPVAFNGAHFHGEVLDKSTMAVIKQTTNMLALTNSMGDNESPSFKLKGQVLARRDRPGVEPEVLIRWCPTLIPDSWVALSEYRAEQLVSLDDLTPSMQGVIADSCLGFNRVLRRKNKRKPNR